jgi:hypothetical protein
MAHLGRTIGGGGVQNIPTDAPHPVTPIRPTQKRRPPPIHLPWGAVRPPAAPNRPLSAVYRSDDVVSRPAAGSSGSPPRTSGKPRLTALAQVSLPPS